MGVQVRFQSSGKRQIWSLFLEREKEGATMEFRIDQLKIQSWKNTRTYNQMFNSYLEEKKEICNSQNGFANTNCVKPK